MRRWYETGFDHVIMEVCRKIHGIPRSSLPPRNYVELLLGTAAAESAFTHRHQLDGGPAKGLWQMEPTTAYDIFENFLRFRESTFERLTGVWLELWSVPFWVPEVEELARHLEYDDKFACAMARLHYIRVSDPIPLDVGSQAQYWKAHYNTPAGAGTVEHYLAQWGDLQCQRMIESAYRGGA